MRKLILIVLPFIYLGACTEPTPPPPPKKTVRVKSKSDNAEDFRAVEKPASY
jgi:hypothetical protein